MSISTDRMGSDGHFANYEPRRKRREARPAMFLMQCRACGFQPDNEIVPPNVCPKCHGSSWERMPRPGSILEFADEE